jgi:hypothetical protein
MQDAGGLHRRDFLRVGGLTVGLAALTAACVNEHEVEQVTQTGTRVPTASTSVPPFPGNAVLDAQLVLTALSVERLAIDTFDRVLKENWVATAATVQLARSVQDHHRRHAEALAGEAAALGQNPAAVTANSSVKEDLVDSEVETVQEAAEGRERETAAVKLFSLVEDALAQLYAKAGGSLTTAELRKSIGAIGVATARQYTVFAGPSGQPIVPFAFLPTAAAAIPEDSYVAADESRARTPGTVSAVPGTAAPGTTAAG